MPCSPHCFTCGKDFKAAANISRALTRDRIAVFRFDFTGLGESGGDFADTTFSSNVGDLIDAAAFLAQTYEAPRILIGHSLGGAAVLQAAARIPFGPGGGDHRCTGKPRSCQTAYGRGHG